MGKEHSRQLKEFLGRENELEIIQRSIESPQNDIVFVMGAGGIGKTRFLQRIQEIYNDENHYIIPNIIDYDDYMLDFEKIIKDEIINTVGREYFEKYLNEIANKEENVRIAYHRKKDIQEKFAEGFNNGIGNKKFILLIDTLEKVTSQDFWTRFIGDLEGLNNIVIVLSGREKHEGKNITRKESFQYLGEVITKYFSSKNKNEILKNFDIHSLLLRSFNEKMIREYFQIKSKLLGIIDNISNNDAFDCIEILTNGKPIMIDLITELILHDKCEKNPLEFLQTKFELYDCMGLAQYNREQLKNKIEIFDKRSVEHLNVGDKGFETLSIEEKVIIYLHLIHFIDRKMIEAFFGKINDESFKRIQDFVYTKALNNDSISLHDKMEDLLKEHLDSFSHQFKLKVYEKAQEVIVHQSEQKRVEKSLLGVHNPKLKTINRRIQILQLDIMRLEFLIDEIVDPTKLLEITFRNYSKKFNEAKLHRYREFTFELVWLASEHEKYMSREQQFQHTLYKADAYTINNNSEKAIAILEELKEQPRLTDEEKINIDNTLAFSYGFLGRLQETYDLQVGVYEHFKKQGDLQKEIFVQNHIGYLLNKMTKYEEAEKQLKQVIKNIKKLLASNINEDELFQSKEAFQILEALAYSQLSNIDRVNGKYESALNMIDEADNIWNETKSINNINFISNIRKGDIYRSQDKYQSSTMAFDRAKNELTSNVNDTDEIDLYLSIALQYLFESELYDDVKDDQKTNKEQLLNDAKKLIEDSLVDCYDDKDQEHILLAREYVEAKAYLTHILIAQNKMEEAYQATMDQYNIAKDRKIPFYILDAITSLAEMGHDIMSYQDVLKEINKNYGVILSYALLFGRIEKIQANQLFEEEKYKESFELYAKAIEKIDSHGGYYQYGIHEELQKIKKRLHTLNDKEKYFYLFKKSLESIKDIKSYSTTIQQWISREEFEL